MLGIARDGTYLDGVAIMLAAEWMYATWCGRAAQAEIENLELKGWVTLHAEPAFQAQADWLRAQIDDATDLEAEDRARLATLFGRALALEVQFHSAAYGG